MSRTLVVVLAVGSILGFMAYHGLNYDWDQDQRPSWMVLDNANVVIDETPNPTLQPTTLAPTMTPATLAPTMTPTSLAPTTAPINKIMACLKLPKPVISRELLNLTTCQTKIPKELLEDPTIYKTLPAGLDSKPVMLLAGDNWGQLCNKMGIFAGMFHHMNTLKLDMGNTIVALSSPFSKTAWALDPELFSSKVFGVLMDCGECEKASALPKRLRCSSIIIHGKLYDLTNNHVFEATHQVNVAKAFHGLRPKSIGYMKELNQVIQPQKALKYLVNQTMTKKFLPVANGEWSVGLHQRYMDSMGFKWLLDRNQYNCHPSANFNEEISSLSNKFNRERKDYFWNEASPGHGFLLRKITAQARQEFELAHHLLITNNYSLSSTQVKILKQEWPLLFSKPRVKILLATDKQTPASESEMHQIDFGTVHELQDYDSCLVKIKHHNMLADMWAMSMLDLHMGNPISSCDDIVAHWRQRNGKLIGSSYPTKCYDGYYR
ncbi:hypothetical protein BASA81_006860 [Batrachochytrium salamandrivorans]|nr:hypothetical protein BASA81_006860 [Batrachochytrium salamandrivorans]